MDNLKDQYTQLLENTNQRLANESTLSKWYCYKIALTARADLEVLQRRGDFI